MIIATVLSKNKVSIRLTDERWKHIITTHPEIDPRNFLSVMNVVKDPDAILKGDIGELLAVKQHGNRIWIVVPYKEINQKDGFVLTAYQTTDSSWLFQREILWNKE